METVTVYLPASAVYDITNIFTGICKEHSDCTDCPFYIPCEFCPGDDPVQAEKYLAQFGFVSQICKDKGRNTTPLSPREAQEAAFEKEDTECR